MTDSAAAISLLSPRQAPAAPTQGSPTQSAIENLIARNIGAPVDKQSNPSELAAAGGDGSGPSARKWEDKDLHAAEAYLRRYGVPLEFLSGPTRDKTLELGLHLGETQRGLDAKTKRYEDRIAELEQHLTKLAAGAGKAPSKERNSKDTAGEAELKAFAEELGADPSKIGPALERWLESRLPKQAEPAANGQSDEVLREVRELAVGSARKQLGEQFPGLQHDALYADVLDTMKSLNGPRYQTLPRGEREVAKMLDAALLVFGAPSSGVGPDKDQTREQRLRSQVPTPQSGQRDPTPKVGVDLARDLISRLGNA